MSINRRQFRSQLIRTKMDREVVRSLPSEGPIKIGGRLSDKFNTHIRLTDKNNNFLGAISGRKLYRLAKAIVRRFEVSQ